MKKTAFTLAEVLLTLGVIGVVAALVLPNLMTNITDKKYEAARKKAWSTIGEAGRIIAINEGMSDAKDAKDFVENYLRKQIKMIDTCANDNLRKCGIETTTDGIKSLAGSPMTMPTSLHSLASGMSNGTTTNNNTTSYGFVMANGYAVNLFYNPNCMPDDPDNNHWGQDRVCVNAVYDMNGLAKPNEVGRDIGFVTVIYPDSSSVAYAPDVVKTNAASAQFDAAPQSCTNQNPNYQLPDRNELLSMYMNGNLLGIASGTYWSASQASPELGWAQHFTNGYRGRNTKSLTGIRAVRQEISYSII